MTTEEAMALAVLKGDMAAAMALADRIQEIRSEGLKVVPVHEINLLRGEMVDTGRVRVVLFAKDGEHDFDVAQTTRAIDNWLRHGTTICLAGVERMEIYEVSERVIDQPPLNEDIVADMTVLQPTSWPSLDDLLPLPTMDWREPPPPLPLPPPPPLSVSDLNIVGDHDD